MLAIGSEIRYRIAAIFAAQWEEFVSSARELIRPVVFETVRKIIACRTPAQKRIYAAVDFVDPS